MKTMEQILVKTLIYATVSTVWATAVFLGMAFVEWSWNPGDWMAPSRILCVALGLGVPLFAIPQLWVME